MVQVYLARLVEEAHISEMAYHFGCFLLEQGANEELAEQTRHSASWASSLALVALLGARLMHQLQLQDTCLDLARVRLEDIAPQFDGCCVPALPERQAWPSLLAAAPMVDFIELSIEREAATPRPLVFWENHLYLTRYFQYEQCIARQVAQVQSESKTTYWYQRLEQRQIDAVVEGLFPQTGKDEETDWQKVAVQTAINKSFSIICGGPGTGKTTTVVKLLAALVELHQRHAKVPFVEANPLKILTSAPTGKAALRLAESVSGSMKKLQLSAQVTVHVPSEAVTIHRLLKPRGFNSFYHNKHRPIAADVLIVDEASMVDLSLMAKLVLALPRHCQLILLGDKEQLASVEAGNVLAEICSTPNVLNRPFITELKKSWRFDGEGGIGQLAHAIKAGQVKQACAILAEGNEQVQWLENTEHSYATLVESVVAHHTELLKLSSSLSEESETELLSQLFDHLSALQMLACVRLGDRGVERLNQAVINRLARKGLIPWQQSHFHGRPVMITENAYHLNLFNGDIGLQLKEPVSGQLMTYFLQPDGGLYKLHCQRLPAHETVYAMTVHKSQGSEFSHAIMVLPDNDASLSREILYTGLTRAKRAFSLMGELQAVEQAVMNQTKRKSGLAKLISAQMELERRRFKSLNKRG